MRDYLGHSRVIKRTVRWLEDKGYSNFQVTLAAYRKKPDFLRRNVGDHEVCAQPDIVCEDGNGVWLIAEIEACDGITEDHAKNQWTTFYHLAIENGWKFLIAVPEYCSNQSNERIKAGTVVAGLLEKYGINCDIILSIPE